MFTDKTDKDGTSDQDSTDEDATSVATSGATSELDLFENVTDRDGETAQLKRHFEVAFLGK